MGQAAVGSRKGIVAVSAVLLALCAPSCALAARGHAFLRAFPEGAPPEVSLSLVSQPRPTGVASGVAVAGTSGDVFVADTGNRRVDVFSSAGHFLRAWGWGVASGAAELQVCSSSCKPGLSGAEPGEFQVPAFVAVDNDPSSASFGEVYVGDAGDDLVAKFDAEGHLIGSWGNNGENASHERVEPNGQLNGETSPGRELFSGGHSESPLAGIAVDAEGDLWVFANDEKLFEFGEGGGSLSKCGVAEGPGSKGIAVGAGRVYMVEASGPTMRVAPNHCSEPVRLTTAARPASGLAIDGFDGDLYVDGAGELVEDLPAGCVVSGSSCQPRAVFGETGKEGEGGEEGVLREGAGVGIDPGSGTVYVANVGTQQVFAYGVAVEADTAPASGMEAHAAVLHATVNPDGTQLSQCEFEYGPTEALGSVVQCDESVASIGSGSAPVAVQAQVKELYGGTTYHFRVRAASAKADVHSEDETFTTSPTARVISVSASEVTGASASLDAVVNPEGLEAKYHFEVGECPTLLACPTSPYPVVLGDNTLAAGGANVPVSQRVEGLLAGHTYHFRLVVQDGSVSAYPDPEGTEEGTFVSPPPGPSCDHPRAQVGSDTLPDCRGYELVTPPSKNGALVESGAFLTAPALAADGSRVVANSVQCFDEPASCVAARLTEGALFAFERGEGGWATRPLAPPPQFSGASWLTYRANNGLVLYAAPPAEGLPEDFYVRQADGSLDALGPLQEAAGLAVASEAVGGPLMATSELSHVAYDGLGLWAFDEAEGKKGGVYEYPGLEGHPLLADVTGTNKNSTSLIGVCGAQLGGRSFVADKFGTLSADGRSVVFMVLACLTGGTEENAGKPVEADSIYERTEGREAQMQTVLVSGRGPAGACSSNACLTSPAGGAEYAGASSDGSRVFFTSAQQLTDSATEDRRKGDSATTRGCPEAASDAGGCNLYLWECPAHCEGGAGEERLVDISAGDLSGRGPQVQGVMGIAEDGSSVYFVAHGVLAGANKNGGSPSPGANNLYVYGPDHEGHDRVAFIGTLASSDEALWTVGIGRANVAPDGRFLVFTSHRALTDDVTRLEGPAQVYRYDAEQELLLRVSVGREGLNDNGNGGLGDALIVPSANGIATGGRADPTMSDDGRFVFFESPVGLTPGALNDVPVAGNAKILTENVYEWEAFEAKAAEAAPACAQPGGCVWLISDGRDVTEGSRGHGNESAVHLLGSDASGQNVFFETADQLVAGDTDSQVDFYDARVDGGFPAAVEAPVCASLEACHPPAPPEPVLPGVASGVFSGLGNLIPGVEGGSRPSVASLTPAGLLTRALAACHRKPRGRERLSCERAARARYRKQLLALALKACARKHGRARVQCVRRARARYGARRGR
jgi:DNA-binding beta-propeller fold protein YncE